MDVLLLPLDGKKENSVVAEKLDDSDMRVTYHKAPNSDGLHVATIFLVGRWAGAKVEWDSEAEGLLISQQENHIVLPIQMGE